MMQRGSTAIGALDKEWPLATGQVKDQSAPFMAMDSFAPVAHK
jgi:hypothetical protein